jgi:hypothetical protein
MHVRLRHLALVALASAPLVAATSRAQGDPTLLGLCTTVGMSVQSTRLADTDSDNKPDRWTTHADFNIAADTPFDPAGPTGSGEPKVYVAFTFHPQGSADAVFIDGTGPGVYFAPVGSGVRLPVKSWKYLPQPDAGIIGFTRGRVRSIAGKLGTLTNKLRVFVTGMGEQMPVAIDTNSIANLGGFLVEETFVVDLRPDQVLCAQATMCCRAQGFPGHLTTPLSIKCKSSPQGCQ